MLRRPLQVLRFGEVRMDALPACKDDKDDPRKQKVFRKEVMLWFAQLTKVNKLPLMKKTAKDVPYMEEKELLEYWEMLGAIIEDLTEDELLLARTAHPVSVSPEDSPILPVPAGTESLRTVAPMPKISPVRPPSHVVRPIVSELQIQSMVDANRGIIQRSRSPPQDRVLPGDVVQPANEPEDVDVLNDMGMEQYDIDMLDEENAAMNATPTPGPEDEEYAADDDEMMEMGGGGIAFSEGDASMDDEEEPESQPREQVAEAAPNDPQEVVVEVDEHADVPNPPSSDDSELDEAPAAQVEGAPVAQVAPNDQEPVVAVEQPQQQPNPAQPVPLPEQAYLVPIVDAENDEFADDGEDPETEEESI